MAEERLLNAVYHELTRIATRLLSHERSDHTLEPSALVHEAYLRLIRQDLPSWENRSHFFAIAAKMMRRVLLDHAKGRHRAKRGGIASRQTVHEEILAEEMTTPFDALEEALRELAIVDARKASVVELRFFGGLSVDETAKALGCSLRTVARDWRLAKAWLVRELGRTAG